MKGHEVIALFFQAKFCQSFAWASHLNLVLGEVRLL
jgi:hypothetical protein